jgi:hypothetical protein
MGDGMSDDTKFWLILTTAVFATVSSVAWAIAVTSIYGRPVPAEERCAWTSETRASAFCMELARKRGS